MIDTEEPRGREIYVRSSGAMEVRFAQRIITVVACPYDEDAEVYWERAGRYITESVAPGSFDGCEYRAKRVHMNRDHDRARICGRGIALHPSRAEGLVADLHVSRSPLGDETLELAADEILFPSIGFAPMIGGEQYLENRTRRRVTRAFLDHIAMVPDPAYLGVEVLAVRAADQARDQLVPHAATPNLDRILAERLTERYSPLP